MSSEFLSNVEECASPRKAVGDFPFLRMMAQVQKPRAEVGEDSMRKTEERPIWVYPKLPYRIMRSRQVGEEPQAFAKHGPAPKHEHGGTR